MATTRSPNYPGVSLPEAVELVTKLYQREKRSPVDAEQAAGALGYRSLSGAARTKLSALRKFDLVEETPTGIRVSDLAMAILHPTNPDERPRALQRAATAPALFRDLSEFVGASDENLISRLVRLGFTEAGAKLAVASYRKTMSLVPGEASEYDDEHDESDTVLEAPELPRATRPRNSETRTNQGSILSIELPGSSPAELRLPDRVTPDGLKALVEWLGTAPQVPEAPAPSDDSPTADPDSSAPPPLSERSPDDAQD